MRFVGADTSDTVPLRGIAHFGQKSAPLREACCCPFRAAYRVLSTPKP